MFIAILGSIIGAIGAVGAAAVSGLLVVTAPFIQRAIGQLFGLS